MTTLVLLRHGRTDWNMQGRLQGRADVPISMETRRELSKLQLPENFSDALCKTSPLSRTIETARCLGVLASEIDERLTEMDWGSWEGKTITNLRNKLGTEFSAAEARGLDLKPPGGESPREVQNRLKPFLEEIAITRQTTLAVTHKGVIRALLSLALNWNFIGAPPAKLDWQSLHVFTLNTEGHPRVDHLNVRLVPIARHRRNSETVTTR